ncbi:MAG: hypothetical protein ABFC94_06095 [Syntrophomonas sp.]
MMDKNMVFNKFGDHYVADDMTFLMGIDLRFTDHLASRMKDCVVLETCTGGGFSTISLAKYTKHVYGGDNVTLIQPPFISLREFEHLPSHECESLYLNGRHELRCLHFGKLARFIGNSEFRV